MESSTDSESNLNTEDQSEAESANDSLNATNDTSGKEAKKKSTSVTGRRRQTNLPREEVQLRRNLQST